MNYIASVTGYLAKIKAKMDDLLNTKDTIGAPGEFGTINRSVLKGFIATLVSGSNYELNKGDLAGLDVQVNDSNVYLHFRLPYSATFDNAMFHLRFNGYSFGSVKVIDVTAVGYVYYPQNDIINKEVRGNLATEIYKDANNNAVVSILLPSAYFTTLTIDSMRVGPNTEIKHGELLCKASKSNRVVFPAVTA